MTDTTLFDGVTPPNPSSDNPLVDKLKAIKNENGEPKYKDVETALDALAASQDFIRTLKEEKTSESTQKAAEIQRLQAELEKRKSVEDVVNSLINKPSEPTKSTDQSQNNGLDEQKVLNLVKSVLEQNSQTATQTQNLNLVVSNLSEKFGDQAKEKIAEVAKSIGITPDQIREMAKANPALVLKLFEGIKPTSKNAPIPSKTSTELNSKPAPTTSTRSVMKGGVTSKDQTDAWNKHRELVLERLGITEG